MLLFHHRSLGGRKNMLIHGFITEITWRYSERFRDNYKCVFVVNLREW